MGLTKPTVLDALKTVPGAHPGTDLVSGGHVIWVSACDSFASIKLQYPGTGPADWARVAGSAHDALRQAAAKANLTLDMLNVEFVNDTGTIISSQRFGRSGPAGQNAPKPPAQPPAAPPAPAGHTPIPGLKPPASPGELPGVRKIVAVGAGKGGVGKSTIAVNLAVGLARRGHSVGLLDGDIYGPSLPTMMGLDTLEPVVIGGMLQPFLVHGVKCMTMGKLVSPDKPLIWRGPMAHGAFKQLAEQTAWGDLDYLIIDLPPGTGDVSLTMAQLLRLTGAVVVCTPQRVAQDDAVRAAGMFKQLGVDVLGVVENMSYFVGDDGKEYDLFGRGGAEHMAQRLSLPYLGAIPITVALRKHGDDGNPAANFLEQDRAGLALRAALDQMVTNTESQVALAGLRQAQTRPVLNIS